MNYSIRPERKEDYREVENHVETVVLLNNLKSSANNHVAINIDIDEYNRIKNG